MLLQSAIVECPLNIGVGGVFPLRIWVHKTNREDFTVGKLEALEKKCDALLIIREDDKERGFYIEGHHTKYLLSFRSALIAAKELAKVVEDTLGIGTTIGYNDRVRPVRRQH